MTEVIRYESLRNGKIGTVVSQTDTETVLEIEGVQKTIKASNLKRWYKPCGIIEEEDVAEENKNVESYAMLNKMVSKPDRPNGDDEPKQDCSKLAVKVINYLEKQGCVTKKTCSYTRVRLPETKRNIMELWWGKRVKNLKIVVRSEAIIGNKELYELGYTYAPTHYYTLDHVYRFDNSSDIKQIYDIMDIVILYEKNWKPDKGLGKGLGRKKGDGKVNGRETLRYKRQVLNIKADNEK